MSRTMQSKASSGAAVRRSDADREQLCVGIDLLADLRADDGLLLVQRVLFLLRDVSAVLAGHQALFAANLAMLLVERRSLRPGEIAFLDLRLYTLVLVGRLPETLPRSSNAVSNRHTRLRLVLRPNALTTPNLV